jgi:cellulose 1,4-beta-cellobiosidase
MRNSLITLVLLGFFATLLGLQAEAFAGNPFAGADFFVNPEYVGEVEATIAQNPSLGTLLRKAANFSTGFWVDKIAKIPNITAVLDGALKQQQRTGRKTVSVFVIYDLPNRDCAAAASNGEITCEDNSCAKGLAQYETQYVNPIISIFKKYPNQPIVAIVEPDSLGNLATNLNIAKCAQAQTAYLSGIAYTIKQLGALSNVASYLDACHGGWLGWDNNRQKAAQVFQQVLNAAGGANLIRGFATNTANYQPLGSMSSTDDPCHLESQYNHCINEVKYVNLLDQALQQVGITGKGYIIDTSRNGVPNTRQDCSNWCNIHGSGFGQRPTANANAVTGLSIIDALYWVKVPGESDGTSSSSSPRYDFHCSSSDSTVPAPEAGNWFASYFITLAQNANPPL